MSSNPDHWQTKHANLEKALLIAHEKDQRDVLVGLYTQAANAAEQHKDVQAARFYLTQAYIYALDIGSEDYSSLQNRLAEYHIRADSRMNNS